MSQNRFSNDSDFDYERRRLARPAAGADSSRAGGAQGGYPGVRSTSGAGRTTVRATADDYRSAGRASVDDYRASSYRGAQSARSGSRPSSGNQQAFHNADAQQYRGASTGRSASDYRASARAAGYERSSYQRPAGASDASRYSRSAQGRYAQAASKQRGSGKLKYVLIVLAALVLIGFIGVNAYTCSLNQKLTKNLDSDVTTVLTPTKKPSDPFYVLVLGVDRSEYREELEEFAGDHFRSDSMILARIDPKAQQATLISLERDTLVEMGEGNWDKINNAHAIGGAAFAVEVVSKYAGVPINHYVEIDFDGFEAIIDALGGIEVDVPITIDDEEAGGYLEAGLQTLDGEDALILARSRHAYDDVGTGDYYRMANQRMIIGAVARKLLESDPLTMSNAVSAIAGYVTTDMSVQDILNVAIWMRGMDLDTDLYSTANPTTSQIIDGIWYDVTDEEAWKIMMNRVDSGLSPTLNAEDSANKGGVPDGSVENTYIINSLYNDTTGDVGSTSDGGVEVLNGSGVAGAANAAVPQLNEYDIWVWVVGDARTYDYERTVIFYNGDENEETARLAKQALGVGVVMPLDKVDKVKSNADVLIIIGKDYV